MLGGGAFGLAGGAGEADGEEVLEIPADAVDAEEAEVVDVHGAAHVRLADFGRINLVEPVDLADLARDVVVQALERVAHVAVFLDAPVHLLEVAVDEVEACAVDHVADAGVLLAVDDVRLGGLAVGGVEEDFLDYVLHVFDADWLRVVVDCGDEGHRADGEVVRLGGVELAGGFACALNRGGYFTGVKRLLGTIAFA